MWLLSKNHSLKKIHSSIRRYWSTPCSEISKSNSKHITLQLTSFFPFFQVFLILFFSITTRPSGFSSHYYSYVDPLLPSFFYCSSFHPRFFILIKMNDGWILTSRTFLIKMNVGWILTSRTSLRASEVLDPYVFENLPAFALTLPYSGSLCCFLRVSYPLSHSPLTPAILLLHLLYYHP